MNILNKEELRKQIREGKEISLDGILEEFKSLLRESLQTASEEELTSHLGYEKHQESENTNYRNGHSKKSLKTKYGQIDVAIPRDREGTFEPKLVPKRERILKGSEELILSLYAKGMSVADISTHLDDLYGYQLSEQTISNITEAIMDKAKEWQNRPLEAIYPIIFMDATVLKIRVDRVVKNVAAYIMLGITLDGKKDIIGIWIGENETSKYWRSMTYGEDTYAGSKIATRGQAWEVYRNQKLTDALSFGVSYVYMQYDYTGSNSFFGADGTPMTMAQAQAAGQNPVESAQDIRAYMRYRF